MDIADFEFILTKIFDRISPKERLGGTNPINADERLALTHRFLATGEALKSLSFQFRISLSAVSYIVKGCCKAIVEKMASEFIKVPSSQEERLLNNLRKGGIFHTPWEQLTENTSRFNNLKMLAHFITTINTVIPSF